MSINGPASAEMFFVERGRWVAASEGVRPGEVLARVADFVETVLPLAQTRRLLHLGCGKGELSLELARRGYKPVAVDISPDVIAVARGRAMAQRVPVAFLAADMARLDFPPYFDAVLAVETTLPFRGKAETFSKPPEQVAALLRPGGRFLFGCAAWRALPAAREVVYEGPGGRAVETFTFDAPTRTVCRTLRVESRSGAREVCWQSYWPDAAEIEAALRAAGFALRGRWHRYDPEATWTDEETPGSIWLAEWRP